MPTRRRAGGAAALAAAVLLTTACGGGGGVITVAAVEPPLDGAGAAFRPPPGAAVVQAGPRPVHTSRRLAGYRVRIVVRPNRAGSRNRVLLSVWRRGRPVSGATVGLRAGMVDMAMGVASYRLGGGRVHSALLPAWGMPGRWGLGFTVTPPGGRPIHVVVDDAMRR